MNLDYRGHCILSHGFESGPHATKVTALAQAAQNVGWSTHCPDYTDLDARQDISPLGDVPQRLQRLLDTVKTAATQHERVVLAGSSLGAYISAIASLQVPTNGLFLLVPPTQMGSMPALDAANVPISIIHAWHDELIAPSEVITWAQARSARLLLVNDEHRLSNHVETCAHAFAQLLQAIE